MFTEAPKPTEAQIAEIERLTVEAQRRHERAEVSYQRCGMGGFLSQWVATMTARKMEKEIEILRNGGCAQFPVLCDAEGNVVADRVFTFENSFNGVPTRSRSWKLPAALADRLGRKWVPAGMNSRIQKQLDLHEEQRWFPARATIAGSGNGLSGCASDYVTEERIKT